MIASLSMSNTQNTANSILPDDVRRQWEYNSQGIWVAENTRKSEAAPYDAYVMENEIQPGGMVMIGKLYAVKDNKPVRTLWNFVAYWHPGEKKVITIQYGNNPDLGNIAIGERIESDNWKREKSIVESYRTDGTSFVVGHDSELTKDAIIGKSFNVIEGEWKPRGEFTWKLEKRKDKS